MRLDESLGAGEGGLDTAALVRGDTVREIARVDIQLTCEPGNRVAGRARLAALDLADVLLGEALARELTLRQTGGDAKLPQTLAEPQGGWARGLSK